MESAPIRGKIRRTIAFHKRRIMHDFGLETNSDLLRFVIKQEVVNQN